MLDVSLGAAGNWSSVTRNGHPGGETILRERAGTDVTEEFHFAVQHSKDAQDMFEAFKVGEVAWTEEEKKAIASADEERRKKEGGCSVC